MLRKKSIIHRFQLSNSFHTTISSPKSKVKRILCVFVSVQRVTITALKTTFDIFRACDSENDSRFCYPYVFLKCIRTAHLVHIMMTHSTNFPVVCVCSRISVVTVSIASLIYKEVLYSNKKGFRVLFYY